MLNENELNVIRESYDKESIDNYRNEFKKKFHGREINVPNFLETGDLNDDVVIKRFKGKSSSGSLILERYIKVFFVLMDMANEFGVVNVTQQELADMLGYSRATINVYMKYLKENLYIEETEKQGRYILIAEAVVSCVDKKYLSYLYDNMNKEDKEKEMISEFEYKFKYYKMATNLGYDWKEFEEHFSEELKKAFSHTPFGDIYNYNKLGVVDKAVLKSKAKRIVEDIKKKEQEDGYVYCTNCCTLVKSGWNFCNACGSKIEKIEEKLEELQVKELMSQFEEMDEMSNQKKEEETLEELSESFINLVNKSGLRYVEGLLKKQYGALHKFYMRNLMEMSGMSEKTSRVVSDREYSPINTGTMQILKKLQKVSELDGCFDEEIGVIVLDDGSQLGFIKGHIPKNMYLKSRNIYNLYLVDFYGKAKYLDFGVDEIPLEFFIRDKVIVIETSRGTYKIEEY